MRNRKLALIAVVLALLALAPRHPSANIQVEMHQASDPAPHRIQAAVDLGLLGFSVLVTWTGKQLTAH